MHKCAAVCMYGGSTCALYPASKGLREEVRERATGKGHGKGPRERAKAKGQGKGPRQRAKGKGQGKGVTT